MTQPSRQGRRRYRPGPPPINPFLDRDNFPPFEEAWQQPPDQQSLCSYASSSSLNLSIGAQAALAEHHRHIEKHGLDESNRASTPSEEDMIDQLSSKDPLDEAWLRLFDPNLSHISHTSVQSGGVTGANPLHGNNLSVDDSAHHYDQILMPDGVEAIEVMTDHQSDYFNSSKVMLLQTPEKKRSQTIDGMSCRRAEQEDDSMSSSEGVEIDIPTKYLTGSTEDIESSLQQTHPESLGNSFVSFQAGDLSRISEDESVGLRLSTPSHRGSLSEHNLALDARANLSNSLQIKSSGWTRFSPIRRPRPRIPSAKVIKDLDTSQQNNKMEKENASVVALAGLSPLAAQAAEAALHASLPGTESFPLHRLSTSSDDESQLRQIVVQYDMSIDSDVSTLHTSSEKKSSSESSTPSPVFPQSLPPDDRRRYRTVVPTRVFWLEPNDFPEQYDSFSAPPPRTSAKLDDKRSTKSYPK